MIKPYLKLWREIKELKKLMLSQKDTLDFNEACKFTGLSKSYMYKLTASRSIPYYKRQGGNRISFDRNEIEQWLKSCPVRTRNQMDDDIEKDMAQVETRGVKKARIKSQK